MIYALIAALPIILTVFLMLGPGWPAKRVIRSWNSRRCRRQSGISPAARADGTGSFKAARQRRASSLWRGNVLWAIASAARMAPT